MKDCLSHSERNSYPLSQTNLRYGTTFFFLVIFDFSDIGRIGLRIVLHGAAIILRSTIGLLRFLSHSDTRHTLAITFRNSRNLRYRTDSYRSEIYMSYNFALSIIERRGPPRLRDYRGHLGSILCKREDWSRSAEEAQGYRTQIP